MGKLLIIIVALVLGGCSLSKIDGLSAEEWRDEYYALKSTNSSLQAQHDDVQSNYSDLEYECSAAEDDAYSEDECEDDYYDEWYDEGYEEGYSEGQSEINYSQTNISNDSRTLYTSNVIESQIDDEFNGWDGETIFKLTNGQIWQQDSYAYTYHYAYRPEVLIYESGSSFKMKVEDVEETITVKRIK